MYFSFQAWEAVKQPKECGDSGRLCLIVAVARKDKSICLDVIKNYQCKISMSLKFEEFFQKCIYK